MSNFRTEYNPAKAPAHLDPSRPIALMGSCFTDNIGAKMERSGWAASINPCGVVYNPASIALLVQLALTHRPQRRAIIESSITERENKFVSWFMDSKSAGDSPEGCVDNVCEAVDRLEEALETSGALIITFGTPDVWLLAGTDRLVGNCHKHPDREFEKHRLSIDEIAGTWLQLISAIRTRNPELTLIFTVSPRRYLGTGMADNSRLKSILLLACEKICGEVENSFYFPAFEIMMDDLRDYRFYDADMLHPSPVAIEYIWQKFQKFFLSPEKIEELKKAEKENRRKFHRQIL